MANRLDASSRWLPAWTPNQAGLPLAAVATGDVCPHIAPLGQAPDTGSQEGPPGTVSRRGVPLTNLTGHIAVVAGGALPASCSYADIVGCGPPVVLFHVSACPSASLWAMHSPLGPLGRGLSSQCLCPNVSLGKLIGTLRWLMAGCSPFFLSWASLGAHQRPPGGASQVSESPLGKVLRLLAGGVLPSSCSQADIIIRTITAVVNHRLRCPCQWGCF